MAGFPSLPVFRTPYGLTRADPDAVSEPCGCGQPSVITLVIPRVKGRGGSRTGKTSRVPLCARHDAARDEQGRRRRAARDRARHAADADLRAAREAQREYASRPVIGFTLISGGEYL